MNYRDKRIPKGVRIAARLEAWMSEGHSLAPRLPRSLSALETWGFAFSGLLLWLFTAPDMLAELGGSGIWVWVPVAIIGMLLNFQVRHFAKSAQDSVGGTPVFTARLFEKQPVLARFAGLSGFQGWIAVPAISALGLGEITRNLLLEIGYTVPRQLLAVGFMIVLFGIAFAGTRVLSILHLFFVIPAVALLLLFIVQGMSHALSTVNAAGAVPSPAPTIHDWMKWFLIAVYAAYAVETGSAFIGDSKHPRSVLRALIAAAVVNPLVFIGGSWVLAASAGSATVAKPLDLIHVAASVMWGSHAITLVSFLLVSGWLLTATTIVGYGSRVLWQMGADGFLSGTLARTSAAGVPTVALSWSLLWCSVYLVMDPSTTFIFTVSNYFVCMALFHLGMWWNRHDPARSKWPWLSLSFFGLETVVFIVGGLELGATRILGALLLPVAMMGIDWGIQAVRIPKLRIFSAEPATISRDRKGGDSVTVHVVSILIIVVGTVLLSWRVFSRLDRDAEYGPFVVVLILLTGSVAVAFSAWLSVRHAQKEEEARKWAESLFRFERDPLLVVEESGAISDCNEAAKVFFGDQVTPELPARLGLTGPPAQWPSRASWEFGAHTFDLSISKVETDRFSSFLISLRDVTAQHQAERNRSAGEFLSIVSHELRTPLTAIHGAVKLLQSGVVNPASQIRMLDVAARNSDRLKRLVDDLLDLQQLQSGAMKLEMAMTNLLTVAVEAAASVRALADERQVTIDVSGSAPMVEADAHRVGQVLTNLLGNAIKYAPAGTAVTATVTADSDFASCSIADRGRGVPPEKLDMIFEPFQQVDASDAREKGGTGLGLPIAKRLIEQHGGRLWVESVPGEGSCFTFTLPVATSHGIVSGNQELLPVM